MARFELKCAEVEAQHDAYDAALVQWQRERRDRIEASGEPTEPRERHSLGLPALCTCEYCTNT